MKLFGYGFRTFLLAICLCVLTVSADAWEFSMRGYFDWRYFTYSQLGSNGFFGAFDVDNGTFGSAGNVNFWHGKRLAFNQNGPDLVTGSDAAGQYTYATIFPQIRFNKAVRLRGRYRIGSWAFNTPATGLGVASLPRSEYLSGGIGGLQQSFSPGYWELFWLSAQTPWGIITVGRRPSIMGCGLIFDGTDNYSVETMSLSTRYGPFRFGMAWYPARAGTTTYYNPLDKSATRQLSASAYVTYRSGPFDIGAQSLHIKASRGPEHDLVLANRVAARIFDRYDHYGTSYMKYANGRFFFNTEASWYYRMQTHSGSAPSYVEHYRGMTEFGVLAGPLKTSFLWAWISGPDRRQGILIDRQSSNPSATYGNTSLFMPFSYILVYTYGGGNNRFTQSRNGFLTDANVYGVRLDYAVAANLNVFGSFFYAERVSNGYGWGYIKPGFTGTNPTGSVTYARVGTAPSIPDNALGYEFDWGFDWKLLEGYRLNGVFGFWQPGKWFNYACVDKSVANWNTQAAAQNWGVNPDRNIDPVLAAEIRFVGEF